MVFFIAGEIDSGKTARMLSVHDCLPLGTCRGFLSIKSYCAGDFAGYDLFELGSGYTLPLARLSLLYGGQFAKPFTFDRFTFDQASFDYGCGRILDAAADDECRNIFIDEVGPMELSGLAFAPALRSLVQSGATTRKSIYIAARLSCIGRISSSFGIDAFTML